LCTCLSHPQAEQQHKERKQIQKARHPSGIQKQMNPRVETVDGAYDGPVNPSLAWLGPRRRRTGRSSKAELLIGPGLL